MVRLPRLEPSVQDRLLRAYHSSRDPAPDTGSGSVGVRRELPYAAGSRARWSAGPNGQVYPNRTNTVPTGKRCSVMTCSPES